MKCYTKPEVLKYGPSLRGPVHKKRGLSISRYGTSNPVNKQFIIWKERKYSEHSPTICQQFSKKHIFHEIRLIIISPRFSVVFTKIVRKFTANFSEKSQEFYKKHFQEFYNFPKFSENFETILVDVRFQFCLAAEFIGQDGAILPDDQPIKLRKRYGKMSNHLIKLSDVQLNKPIHCIRAKTSSYVSPVRKLVKTRPHKAMASSQIKSIDHEVTLSAFC